MYMKLITWGRCEALLSNLLDIIENCLLYNEQYFFDKGALFTAISIRFRHFLMLQYLLRHKDVLIKYKLFSAYKIMLKGSKEYINEIRKI